jgi:hypothetical protein
MKVALAVASTLVAALMILPNASAGSSTVSFADPVGDIGPDKWYSLPTDPNDPSATSTPICQATYLDMVSGWVTTKDGKSVTFGFELAGTVDESIVLPPGATGVLWVWYMYTASEPIYYADLMLVLSWDGEEFQAYLKHRTEMGAVPYPYWELAFQPEGSTVQLTIDKAQPEALALALAANWWFAETKVWLSQLIEPFEDWALPPNYGGWAPVDINDWDPAVSSLPFLPMP